MRLLIAAMVALSMGWSVQAMAATADISLNNSAARIAYGSFVGSTGGSRTQFDAGLLYNNDSDTVVHTGLHLVDVVAANAPGIQVAIGGRIYYADAASQNTLALALGGQVRFKVPQAERVGLVLHGHYAPGIVTFWDGKSFSEYGGRIEYSLMNQARIYLGYRNVSVDFGRKDTSVDKAGHVGLAIDF